MKKLPPDRMSQNLTFAVCQFPVFGDMAANSRYIVKYMRCAADRGADVIHFPESSLPGHARLDLPSFADFDWSARSDYTSEIMKLAQRLNIWTVLGSCRQATAHEKPRNVLHSIPDKELGWTYDNGEGLN